MRAALREHDKSLFDDLLSHIITTSSLTQQSADVTISNVSKTDTMSAAAMSAMTPSNDMSNTLSESDTTQDLSYGANNKDIKMSCQQKNHNIPSACLQVIFLLLNIDIYSFSLTCI